jgi:hypothetical protein
LIPTEYRSARAAAVLIWLAASAAALGQTGGTALTGAVTKAAGAPVPNALIAVRNTATGQTVETRSDPSGRYSLPNLAPGEYEVTVSAPGFAAKTVKTALAAGAAQTLNLEMTPGAAQPSLSDLGFAPTETQGNAAEQARLERRTRMLKTHQKLGLITAVPMIATFIAANGAAGRSSSASGRNIHMGLGIATAGMYFTTASYAIRAPRIQGTKTHGPIKIHKALAWIHGPGMVLTPILGAMAYHQRSNGQRVHGIASAHGAVATITGIAYGAALLSVTVKF